MHIAERGVAGKPRFAPLSLARSAVARRQSRNPRKAERFVSGGVGDSTKRARHRENRKETWSPRGGNTWTAVISARCCVQLVVPRSIQVSLVAVPASVGRQLCLVTCWDSVLFKIDTALSDCWNLPSRSCRQGACTCSGVARFGHVPSRSAIVHFSCACWQRPETSYVFGFSFLVVEPNMIVVLAETGGFRALFTRAQIFCADVLLGFHCAQEFVDAALAHDFEVIWH